MTRKVTNTGSMIPTGISDAAFKRMSKTLVEKVVAREFKAHSVWDISGTQADPFISRTHQEPGGDPTFSDDDVHRVDLGSSIVLFLGNEKYSATIVDISDDQYVIGIGDDVIRIAKADLEFEHTAQQFGPATQMQKMEIQYIQQGGRFQLGENQSKTFVVTGPSRDGSFVVARDVATNEEIQLPKQQRVLGV